MGCELRDDLGSQYLASLDSVRRAQQRLNCAVTIMNVECARTELRRVEDYRHAVLLEILDHCESHDCATQDLEELCGQLLGSRKLAVA